MATTAPQRVTVAVTVGDPTGIGPEVTLKALATALTEDETDFVLFGDEAALQRLPVARKVLGHPRLSLKSPASALPEKLAPAAPEAARAAMAWLEAGARLCLSGGADALLTGPVSKHAIIDAGFAGFVGQTEFLAGLANAQKPVMMLLGTDDRDRWLRVALATTHVRLRDVPTLLTREKITHAISESVRACARLRLPRARVAVCGLNPHAGESGALGDEEITTILPAVEAAKASGLDVAGPLSADTVFRQAIRGEYDAVVAMYHDQGLAPLKLVAFERGINWSLGLPFIRTSPDHGTAYDIAGRDAADPSSTLAALRLARQLARDRKRAGQGA